MDSFVRDWTSFRSFPAATQVKIVEFFGKLRQEGVTSLTILVMGKGGVGKSSTVNSLVGEGAVRVSAFQAEGLRPVIVSRTQGGFTLTIIDTPGLVEGGFVNHQALEMIKGFLLNKTIDAMLFVDRLDAYRVDDMDKQVIRAITQCFGKEIWHRSLLVLTHAQLCPPDEISYDIFSSRRSEALLKTIRAGARIRKQEVEEYAIPVVLVENSGRCNKNDDDEKILPNGEAWLPKLVEAITDVATSKSKAIVVDKKLIEGSDSDNKGKKFIPLILAVQYVIVKLIQQTIRNDIASGGRPF